MSNKMGWSDEDLGPDYTKDVDSAVRYLTDPRNRTTSDLYKSLAQLVKTACADRTGRPVVIDSWHGRSWKTVEDVVAAFESMA